MNRKTKKSKQQNQDLYQQLNAATSNKKKLKSQLKSSIKKSNVMIQKSQSASILPNIQSQNNQSQLLRLKKQQSLLQLSRSLNQRIQADRQAKVKLQQMTDQYTAKKRKLQKRIQQIKKRNMTRMRQLNQFQEKYIKKLMAEYKKDKEIEQGLIEEYQFVLRQQGRAKQTSAFREIIEAEDWQQVLKQKKRLQAKIRQYTRKQQNLIKDQNPQHMQKIQQKNQKKLQQQKALAAASAQKSQVAKVKVDAKQIGNQYLQYAKKIKQLPKDKSKIRMLDVNLKSIDYGNQIMNKIARNTSDLSRYRIEKQALQTKNTINKDKNSSSLKMPIFQIKQDEQTKRNLKQIKANLKQIQKRN